MRIIWLLILFSGNGLLGQNTKLDTVKESAHPYYLINKDWNELPKSIEIRTLETKYGEKYDNLAGCLGYLMLDDGTDSLGTEIIFDRIRQISQKLIEVETPIIIWQGHNAFFHAEKANQYVKHLGLTFIGFSSCLSDGRELDGHNVINQMTKEYLNSINSDWEMELQMKLYPEQDDNRKKKEKRIGKK